MAVKKKGRKTKSKILCNQEKKHPAAPAKILMVVGPNGSGKTRLLRFLKYWLGEKAGYYDCELPDNPSEEYLLLNDPLREKTVGQIEELAKGHKVIVALRDEHMFGFSSKTQLNILKINRLETYVVGRETHLEILRQERGYPDGNGR